jgi:hypothetical protein
MLAGALRGKLERNFVTGRALRSSRQVLRYRQDCGQLDRCIVTYQFRSRITTRISEYAARRAARHIIPTSARCQSIWQDRRTDRRPGQRQVLAIESNRDIANPCNVSSRAPMMTIRSPGLAIATILSPHLSRAAIYSAGTPAAATASTMVSLP